MRKLCIIVGTRPEIIKMSPVILECEKRGIPYFILHTGQHYSPRMDRIFFKELALPAPAYNLKRRDLSYQKQIGFFIADIRKILSREKPDIVLVQGDTSTVVAGALAANKEGIAVGHHEAGLRSYDVTMPEEINRTITDHISDFLFAPTQIAVKNLIDEGVGRKKIFLTGNTIVDVVKKYNYLLKEEPIKLPAFTLKSKKYFLVTVHRAENVDNRERILRIFEGLRRVDQNFPDFQMVLPLHPRTQKVIKKADIKLSPGIHTIDPVGYFDMLRLQNNARLIITDSGGVQEEAALMRVPVVTIRDNTERPETVELGFNTLVPGVFPSAILAKVEEMLKKDFIWSNPFGDGKSGKRIVSLLLKLV